MMHTMNETKLIYRECQIYLAIIDQL